MSFSLSLSGRAASSDLRRNAQRLLNAAAIAYGAPEMIALTLGQKRGGGTSPTGYPTPAVASAER
jgi:hypothetical protein